MSEFAVELADLRGWARQVGRASDDMGDSKTYATTHIADADFGRILEMISGDYAALLGKFHAVLGADSTGLNGTQTSLNTAATAYRQADEAAVGELAHLPGGQTGTVTNDGVATGFADTGEPTAKLVSPSSSGVQLPDPPEVSFGFIFDKVCGLIDWLGGPDLREEVAKWLSGDLDKASMQVAAWKAVADCVDAVERNLLSGRDAITGTWTGSASDAAGNQMGRWTSALSGQSEAMRMMSEHLADIVDMAVQMAQVVIDIIRTVISVISAGLANASIPFYGQWKLIQSVREGITMVWNAIKVIQVFVNALTMFLDTVKMCVDYFSVDDLPAAPAGVPG